MLAFFSCKQASKPDVSDIKLDLKVERFDRDLYQGKSEDLQKTDQLLQKKYGAFYQDYIHRMVGDASYTGPEILTTLYKDPAYTDLNKEADSVFKNMDHIEKDLTQTFKYIKHYYPNVKIPRMISFVSGFAVQTPIGDDYIGIGLDMFLGKNSKFYGAIVQSVPSYLSRRFSPEYVVPRVTETYAREDLFPEKDEDRTLLSKMIQNGKILYFMDQVLADEVPDSVKIGYTKAQIDWCKTYEVDIWAYLLQNNLLFETDYQKIQVFLGEGPFTPGLGDKQESAPKLGVWMGWQMVRKYMEENKEVTLQQLMAEKDPQKILNLSKYKPK
ncbi:gliding motility lipoprotein GldB [Pedobacter gandavensis]|uniref:gliding motility lipoprotein GldB n=1 Tax=Pedobacter TaxID=84567 RepID=UPI002107ABB8|nr:MULTISPECIES: gliding motility lipoprotein GldB [Pedobacter]WGQ08206.1 gliding motility lipoprotein GldB [Pedobacter gandavensis]